MRWGYLVLGFVLCGCDDDLEYVDGTVWQPVEERVEMPFRAPRVPLSQMNAREQQQFFASAGILADGEIKTFTPTWGVGFSSDPVGDISYYDFGAVVMLWRDTALVGTSDTAAMSFGGLPESIRPKAGGRVLKCLVEVGINYFDAVCSVFTSGTVAFGLSDTVAVGGTVTYTDSFPAAGSKGLPAGWLIMYSK